VTSLACAKSQRPIFALNWRLNIEEVGGSIFQIDSNLADLLRIDPIELHELLKSSFFEVTGVKLHLRRTKAVNAAACLAESAARIIERTSQDDDCRQET
jgi:hypothetical protein